MRKTDLLFSAFYMAVLLVAASQISQLSDISDAVVSAKLFPWLVIITGMALGVLEIGRTLLSSPDMNAPGFSIIWAKAFAPRRMVLLALFIAYLYAIELFGFLVATGLFCFITVMTLAPLRSPRTAITAIAVSIGTLTLIYVLLVIYLEAFLP